MSPQNTTPSGRGRAEAQPTPSPLYTGTEEGCCPLTRKTQLLPSPSGTGTWTADRPRSESEIRIEPENHRSGSVEPWWVADEPDPAEREAAARRLRERQREFRDSFIEEYGFMPLTIGPDGKPRPPQESGSDHYQMARTPSRCGLPSKRP